MLEPEPEIEEEEEEETKPEEAAAELAEAVAGEGKMFFYSLWFSFRLDSVFKLPCIKKQFFCKYFLAS